MAYGAIIASRLARSSHVLASAMSQAPAAHRTAPPLLSRLGSVVRAFSSKPAAADVMEGKTPRVIENKDGARTTPSIVAKNQNGDLLIGITASRQAVTNTQNTICGSKCLIGRTFDDPQTQKEVNMVTNDPLIDLKNSADTTIYSIEKSVSEFKDKVPAEVTQEIEFAVSDLRAAMAEDDLEKIKQKLEAANKAVSKIGEHMRTRFRKQHRGRVMEESCGGNHICFGRYALQVLEPAWISARQIEAGRRALSRYARGGKLWVRIFPDKPVTRKGAGTRMGRGKGSLAYLAAVVKPGRILYEMSGVSETIAREAISLAANKMPIQCQFRRLEI